MSLFNMDQSLEVTNAKNEEIRNEMPINSIKEENNYLVLSEIAIKTEPQENESEYPIIAYQMCPNYDVKIEVDESIVKLKCENLKSQIMEDPLDVSKEIKEEDICFGKHFLDNEKGFESQAKTHTSYPFYKKGNHSGWTEGEMEGAAYLSMPVKEKQYQSSTSNNQNELHLKNKQICKNKKHVCHVCNQIFSKKSNLDAHLRIHTGEKPFTCHICKKSFKEKSTMKRHMLIHSDEKPHECDMCKKVFKDKSDLSKHKFTHSGVKPFSCYVCYKSFTYKHNLADHERIHTGLKPYICDFCQKAFSKQSNLNRHRRLHT